MQLAARKVAWENGILRDLLADKGVSDQDIEAFVRNRERTDLVPTSSDTVARASLQGGEGVGVHDRSIETSHIGSRTGVRGMRRDCSSGRQRTSNASTALGGHEAIFNSPGLRHGQVTAPPRPANDPRPTDFSAPSVLSPIGGDCSRNTSGLPPGIEGEQQSLSLTVSDCFRLAARNESVPTRDDSMLEMSCETAANIIAGMRGNGDKIRARRELGCDGEMQCNVKNIMVLQALG